MPLVASSTVSTDDLAVVTLGLPHPVVALVPGVSGASGGSQGATDIKVVGTRPQLGNDAGSLIRDLMMHSVITGVPGSAVLGDVAPAPGSSGVVGPGVSGLYLSGSLDFLTPPIN
jgi:hypothetical protein